MPSWNRIKEDLEQGVNIAKKSAQYFADKAVSETETLRHKMLVKSYETKIDACYAQMGKLVYNELARKNWNLQELAELASIVSEIDKLILQRQLEEEKIEKIRNGET